MSKPTRAPSNRRIPPRSSYNSVVEVVRDDMPTYTKGSVLRQYDDDRYKEAQEAMDMIAKGRRTFSSYDPDLQGWIRLLERSQDKKMRAELKNRKPLRKAPPRRAAGIPLPPGKAPHSVAYRPKPYVKSRTYYKTPTPRKKTGMNWSAPDSMGSTIGGWLGHGIQGVVKALTGFGDYKVRGNSLMSGTLGGNPPIMRNSRSNGIIVRHREYLADVFAATAFTTTTYPINPGLISTFPWLQQQADSFEQYKFRGLVFEFKTMSSDAVLSTSASSALGTVIMSTQYNVLDQVFTDKRTMENYEYANSSKPSCSILHPIECKMSQTTVSELYVRTGGISAGDLRLYDLGNFSIAVQGMQNAAANQVIGELWCTYEIEFFKPKLLIGGGALLTDHWFGTGTNIFSDLAQFGLPTTMSKRSGSNLGTILQIPVSGGAPNLIVFPLYVVDGKYLITYAFSGSVNTATTPPYTAAGAKVNCITQSVMIGGTSSFTLTPPGTTAAVMGFTLQQVIQITQSLPGVPPSFEIAWNAGTYPSGVQICDLIITQLAPGTN